MTPFDPDSFEARVVGSLSRIEEKISVLPEHTTRIYKLEGAVSWAKGLWVGLSFIISLIGAALVKHLFGGNSKP
jgi:hypothetical protein